MEKKPDPELIEFTIIGNRAVKKAQELNWKKGLPNVYSKNKKMYYEFPEETDEKDKDTDRTTKDSQQ